MQTGGGDNRSDGLANNLPMMKPDRILPLSTFKAGTRDYYFMNEFRHMMTPMSLLWRDIVI